MDFNPETQTFHLSDEEAETLHIHPAWTVCRRQDALKLFTLISRSTHLTIDITDARTVSLQELQRRTVAAQTAHDILAQLEPYVNADIQLLSDQLPAQPPDTLE